MAECRKSAQDSGVCVALCSICDSIRPCLHFIFFVFTVVDCNSSLRRTRLISALPSPLFGWSCSSPLILDEEDLGCFAVLLRNASTHQAVCHPIHNVIAAESRQHLTNYFHYVTLYSVSMGHVPIGTCGDGPCFVSSFRAASAGPSIPKACHELESHPKVGASHPWLHEGA